MSDELSDGAGVAKRVGRLHRGFGLLIGPALGQPPRMSEVYDRERCPDDWLGVGEGIKTINLASVRIVITEKGGRSHDERCVGDVGLDSLESLGLSQASAFDQSVCRGLQEARGANKATKATHQPSKPSVDGVSGRR